MLRGAAFVVGLALAAVSCGGSDGGAQPATSSSAPAPDTSTTTAPGTTATTTAPTTAPRPSGPVELQVTEVARGLQVPWALAWDPSGALWVTQRTGTLTKINGESREIAGVSPIGEGGLMGLEIDRQGRMFLMYTSAQDNRIVRLEADGSQTVLVSGIARASIHDGGRLRFGPDGALYASTGDASRTALAPDPSSLNGKVLKVDPNNGGATVFSRGHRNPEGLCFAPGGRFLSTEHGPVGNDEINVLTEGFDGGWPGTAGNGIRNYSPSVAPAGCVVYSADLIPQWRGSMLFGTLRGESLRRLTFAPDGSVSGEEVLYEDRYGRIRDVAVGPDGAVYFTTSNRDGRGSPRAGDDRILRIGPAR
ncbi:MAG TPA: PQQ-dependent sugar dehydrogenase [Acidimicrobiales bacterium]|nr:PQQ-dependent sugar dehydrogenase [Acidimicrobiales bacterium]